MALLIQHHIRRSCSGTTSFEFRCMFLNPSTNNRPGGTIEECAAATGMDRMRRSRLFGQVPGEAVVGCWFDHSPKLHCSIGSVCASRAPDADGADYTSRSTRQGCASVRCRWPMGTD